MNRRQEVLATFGLIFITFLAAIQYIFLQNVPDDISTFAFVFITNLIGIVILGLVQIKKVISIKKSTLAKGIVFAVELTGFNYFVLLGSKNLDVVVVSSVVSLYFIFITPLLLLLKKKVSFFSAIASVIAVVALLLMFGADTDALFSSREVVYLIIADMFFAAYVVSVSILGKNEESTQLTFAQMLFSALFALVGWAIQCLVSNTSLSIPTQPKFWVSALFMGIFIRAIYGLLQIQCQKYVSALKASLIFSAEIIITLVTNPIMCKLFGVEYTPATIFQVIGAILLIIATLMVDETIMAKIGYEDLMDTELNDPDSPDGKKVSVTRKIILATLTFTLITLILSTVICLSAIHFIRHSAISGSKELGLSASEISSTAMMEQLEEKISNQARDKSLLAEQKLKVYSDAVLSAASYAHLLYANKEDFPKIEVQRPNKKNAGKWVMQRTLASSDISYYSLVEESELLGNMEKIFEPLKDTIPNLVTIYMATTNGLLISYDTYSDTGDSGGEGYFDYRDSSWYKAAQEKDGASFTDTYQDSYGRGLTITCVAPFTDENGKFAGCVAMDVLMSELNESMVNDGIVIPSEAILIDSEGGYIAGKEIDPSLEDMGSIFDEDKNEALRIAANEILSRPSAVVSAGEGDNEHYIAFSTIESTGWKLCIISPVSTVIEPARIIHDNIDENTDNVVTSVEKGILTVIQSCLVLIAFVLIVVTSVVGTISRRISDPLKKLEKDVRIISGGNLDNRTEVDTNDEIGSLARSFNNMADSLQKYIVDLKEATAKEERIAGELAIATNIQASMLPRNFDLLSEHKAFDLYATMTPAKEVGGDFYDFFMVDENHLALVMADVSGKGVPAALFMVIAKTLIKNRAQLGGSPSEVLEYANEQLCEGNDEGLFVTVWLAIIDLTTGKGLAANAGHEHPAIRRAGGVWELVKYKHGAAVAVMEGLPFKEHEFEIHPGDSLYVYTDGVTEATDSNNELFGEDRLIAALNSDPEAEPKELLENVKNSIDEFVGEAPQFDDITMLSFIWRN